MKVLTANKTRSYVPKYQTMLDGVDLSFANVQEFERTKHVHRLHPY